MGADDTTTAVASSSIVVCGMGDPISPVDVTLPNATTTSLERYEGMLVRFPQTLVIAEYFNYDQFGEIVLALPLDGESRPFTRNRDRRAGRGRQCPDARQQPEPDHARRRARGVRIRRRCAIRTVSRSP